MRRRIKDTPYIGQSSNKGVFLHENEQFSGENSSILGEN